MKAYLLLFFIMHNVAQLALQVVTQARQDTKIYPGNLVLTVLLQLCPLDAGTKNNGVFTDAVSQPIFLQCQNNTTGRFVFV